MFFCAKEEHHNPLILENIAIGTGFNKAKSILEFPHPKETVTKSRLEVRVWLAPMVTNCPQRLPSLGVFARLSPPSGHIRKKHNHFPFLAQPHPSFHSEVRNG